MVELYGSRSSTAAAVSSTATRPSSPTSDAVWIRRARHGRGLQRQWEHSSALLAVHARERDGVGQKGKTVVRCGSLAA